MKNFLRVTGMVGILFSCTVDEEKPTSNPDVVPETLMMELQLSGSEWLDVNERETRHQFYGYKVFRQKDNEDELWLSGVSRELPGTFLELEENASYRIDVSAVEFYDAFDSESKFSIFSQETERAKDFYNLQQSSAFQFNILPFNTHLGRTGEEGYELEIWPSSDKLVGQSLFTATTDQEYIEVEMHRLSAGLAFEINEQPKGEVHFRIAGPETKTYILTPQKLKVTDILLLFDFEGEEDIFEQGTFGIEEDVQVYTVDVFLVEVNQQGEREERKILTEEEVQLKRNHLRTYELDITPFAQQNQENPDQQVSFTFVDEPMNDRGTVRIGASD